MPGSLIGPGGTLIGPVSGTTSSLAQIAVSDLINDILREIRVLSAVDPALPQDAEYVLRKINRTLDNWNADIRLAYAEVLSTFTLTPALQPHTIGPTGTIVQAQRPVSLQGASLNVSGSWIPIDVRDATWWLEQPNKTMTSDIPSVVYYEPEWPNGSLYFWPVPSSANQVALLMRQVLAQLTIGTTVTFPPGYLDALILNVGFECVGPFKVDMPTRLEERAREALARIMANNIESPPLETRDFGIPGAGGGFDYRTRSFV